MGIQQVEAIKRRGREGVTVCVEMPAAMHACQYVRRLVGGNLHRGSGGQMQKNIYI